jgi:hypothetical protein
MARKTYPEEKILSVLKEVADGATIGAAGLRMGWALLRPGTRSRLGALQAQVPDLVPIVVTAAAMLLVAAGIEAWWSPSTVAAPVKWGVAATLWVSVIAWLSLAGRTR